MAYHHLSVLVRRQAEKYGDKVALEYRDYERAQWLPVTWNQFAAAVRQVANALLELGVEVQENVGMFSQNKPECLYVSFAAYAVRAVAIPLYATSSPEQVRYIVNDSQLRFLFVGEQFQYDAAFRVLGMCHSLLRLIIFDRSVVRDPRDVTSVYFDDFLKLGAGLPRQAEVERRTAEVGADDVADILYTSGTTGEPKGVPLAHSNYMEAFRTHELRIPGLTDQDVSLCFLPLTHVFERGWTYVCLERGARVCVNLRPTDVQQALKEVRPTVMSSVPRFWEKVYQGVQERMAQESGVRRRMMEDAIRVGREHNLSYVRLGKRPPLWLHLRYKFYRAYGVCPAEADDRHRARAHLPYGGSGCVRRDMRVCPLRRHQHGGGLRAHGVHGHGVLFPRAWLRGRFGGRADARPGGEDRPRQRDTAARQDHHARLLQEDRGHGGGISMPTAGSIRATRAISGGGYST